MIVAALSLSAPYQIASDQYRLRYRTVDGGTYLEFPRQAGFLKSIAGNRLITVANCDDTKVAVLPLLPHKPLFLENNIIDKLGFRRLPDLQIENVTLNIAASIGRSRTSGDAHHGSFGFGVGFSSTDQATIPVTSIFPRSMKCKQNDVPLLPVLEVLPWNPDDVGSLVEATIKVNQFRKRYPEHSISLDHLREMHMNGDGSYGALLDFIEYSLIYQMFDGNVFAQIRAHLGNTLCALADGHPSAFSGPFAALPENFIRRLVAQLKSNVRLAAPACHVSEDLVLAYEKTPSMDEPLLPFDVTFKKCLEATTSMAQCLAKGDVPRSRPICEGLTCSTPAPPAIPDEILLEDYDEQFFSTLLATKQNRLVDVRSIKPSECPDLRDREENKHFVDWWIYHAKKIVEEPAECSSPAWRAKYTRSQEELNDALACASKRNIEDTRYEGLGSNLIDMIYAAKCNGKFDLDKVVILEQMSGLFDQIDSIVTRLNRYSIIIGDSEGQPLIRAFQGFVAMKQSVCGTRDVRACIDEYGVWQDYHRLVSKITESLGLSNLGEGEGALIDAFSKLDNIIIDMAICDALQDEEFSKRTGYDRKAYCDSHGLTKYRLIGSEPVRYSMQRGNDERDPGVSYLFESNGTYKQFEIQRFLDK